MNAIEAEITQLREQLQLAKALLVRTRRQNNSEVKDREFIRLVTLEKQLGLATHQPTD
mgnify:CR=1 FL=1